MIEEVKWDRNHYSNGQLWFEIPYVNGRRHGIQREWNSNGHLWVETPWVNDQAHGIRRGWDKNGQLWFVQKYHRDQRVIDIEFNPIPDDATMELDLITNEMSYE